MPKFKILVQQYVEEVGEFEIEADTVEEALYEARCMDLYEAAEDTWRDGGDAYKAEIYAIMDEAENLAWER